MATNRELIYTLARLSLRFTTGKMPSRFMINLNRRSLSQHGPFHNYRFCARTSTLHDLLITMKTPSSCGRPRWPLARWTLFPAYCEFGSILLVRAIYNRLQSSRIQRSYRPFFYTDHQQPARTKASRSSGSPLGWRHLDARTRQYSLTKQA